MTESGERRSTPSQGADVGRALGIVIDALVVSPLESGISAVRDPAAAIGRARQELRNARMIGSMITNGGMAAFTATTGLRAPSPPAKRARPATPARPATGDETPSSEAASTAPSRRSAGSRPTPTPTAGTADRDPAAVPDADSLAVPDYDQLPAIDIIDQLSDLSDDERAAIETYELAHRRRRTVLGKLDQLRTS
ncbi:MAG: hypothetical protein AAF945_13510 [Actinomycetota bacterium]